MRCDSGSAPDSVLRRSQRTFQVATETGTRLSAVVVMAAMKVFFGGFSAFFALLRVVPELSANNNNTIWGGSVLTGEEPPPHSGELKHALTQAGGPTQSQLSRPMSSGHHISMEHRLRRKQLNSDTNASNKKYLKEIQEKRKEETFFFRKNEKRK